MGRTPGCVRSGGRGENARREKEGAREREQENWGSWRDIRKGGIEEECVSGERTDEQARTVIQGFFFPFHGRFA